MSTQRINNYARIASTPSAAGCTLVTGVVIAAIPGSATAGLQIWNVGQALPQISYAAPASQDLQLQATFNTAFQINFFGTTDNGDAEDMVFWAPNNNLSFINYGSTASSTAGNDPAIWMNTVLIGPDALNGASSNYGYIHHFWFGAADSHTTSNDIQQAISAGETGAFGIRFMSEPERYHYGWVEVSMDANEIITVERWALETDFNTTAEYSPAGSTAVPGLGGLAALAIGAAGVRSRRQRAIA
ncbi:MAG: hypothetical protein P8I44_08430 [Phycisphaerales bacterium]|nr:hypothetical protein [Phycisphaerales bacterium]MDG1978577.1 hypothetical protein [Phycisphaerales bacterium]